MNTCTDNCSAGYLCISGSGTPTPDGSNPSVGIPCPLGYYCPEGTVNPEKCPTGLVINNEGASSINNCTDCPAGFICTNSSTIAQPCNPGYYCPFMSESVPCPSGSWSNIEMATNQSACLLCPEGFWCPEIATVNPLMNPCPIGHYCPLGTGSLAGFNLTANPIPCPAGTYRSEVSAGSLDDCHKCPAGYYCPESTTICFNCTDAAVIGLKKKNKVCFQIKNYIRSCKMKLKKC